MIRSTQARPFPRKAYTKPKLVRYGDVRTLTQSGSQPMMENVANPARTMGSSRDIKENIVRVGEHPLGIGIYLFDYKAGFRDAYGRGRKLGPMADEVEEVMPGAVSIHPQGHKVVDYAMLGIRRGAG